jgi:hypothetical protein
MSFVQRVLRDASCLALAALAVVPTAATSQVLYKWIDNDGKSQYSDHLPKNFSGPVTRIEAEAYPAPRVIPAPPATAATDEVKPQPAADAAKKRRELRAKLEAELTQARARYEAAKAAVDEGGNPQDEERQVVQQRFDRAQAGRSNCRLAKGADGKTFAICPAVVPNDAYYDRVKQLEDALKQAEDALAAAQEAYRRGVD